jgi:DNA-binding LytR/AlgR family response regulator
MPELDGISLGRYLRKKSKNTCIIYISNREDKVFKTFAVSPLRFIRKSHFLNEIDECITEIGRWWKDRQSSLLALPSREGVISIPIVSIRYIECFAKVQYIVTDTNTISVKLTMTELEKSLAGHGFIKPYKGYLVNCSAISCIDAKGITLHDGNVLPVSKSKIAETKQAFLRFVSAGS